MMDLRIDKRSSHNSSIKLKNESRKHGPSVKVGRVFKQPGGLGRSTRRFNPEERARRDWRLLTPPYINEQTNKRSISPVDYEELYEKTETKIHLEEKPKVFKEIPKVYEGKSKVYDGKVKVYDGNAKVIEVKPDVSEKRFKVEEIPIGFEEKPKVFKEVPKIFKEVPKIFKEVPKVLEGPPKDKPQTIVAFPRSEGYTELSPLMNRMVEEELKNIMINVWQTLPDDAPTDAEKMVINKLKTTAGDDLRNTIGLNVTKRLLNVHNGILVKVKVRSHISNEDLQDFANIFKINDFKYVLARTYAGRISSWADLDELYSVKNLKCGNSPVTVTPVYHFMKCPPNLRTVFNVQQDSTSKEMEKEATKTIKKTDGKVLVTADKVLAQEAKKEIAKKNITKDKVLDAKVDVKKEETVPLNISKTVNIAPKRIVETNNVNKKVSPIKPSQTSFINKAIQNEKQTNAKTITAEPSKLLSKPTIQGDSIKTEVKSAIKIEPAETTTYKPKVTDNTPKKEIIIPKPNENKPVTNTVNVVPTKAPINEPVKPVANKPSVTTISPKKQVVNPKPDQQRNPEVKVIKVEPTNIIVKIQTKTVAKEPDRLVTKEPAKVVAKVVAKEPIKVVAKEPAKVVTKEPAKVIVKEPAKVVAKEPAKVVAKGVAKEPVKVVAKEPVKVIVKEPAKVIAKEPAKVVAKEPAKVVAKGVAKEPVKVVAKEPVKVIVKEPAKVIAKEPAKVVAKQPVRMVTKPPAKAIITNPLKKEIIKPTEVKKHDTKVAMPLNKPSFKDSRKPVNTKKKTIPKSKPNDFDELSDHDILALLSGGIVLDECSGSDED